MIKQSIFKRIKANIAEDGKLSQDFDLERPKAPNEMKFAPGSMDGAGIFNHYNLEERVDKATQIEKLIKNHIRKGNKAYIKELETIFNDLRAIEVVDSLLQGLRDTHDDIEPLQIFEFGYNLVKTNTEPELVKIGISLLGLFDLGEHESIKDIVVTLALCDEFTLYSVVAASNWSNGNDIIFSIAKLVDGWGKIHAVERLEPETAEIQEWILYEGCPNNIMDAYLGLPCAVKGDMISALRQNTINSKLYKKIAVIIDALLDEGPVPGISEYEHASEAMHLFMSHSIIHAEELKDLWHILNVQMWAFESELSSKDYVLSKCDEIISRPHWREMILNTVSNSHDDSMLFYATNAASRMEFDILDELFLRVKANPIKHLSHIQSLFKNPGITIELIGIYESVLPLNEMADGMGDYLFSKKYRDEYRCLDFLLPELASYPLHGMLLIKTGLNCRVVRNRNMACRALIGWVKKLSKSLADISPELYSELKRICENEIKVNTKELMSTLLSGDIENIVSQDI